jgi:acyl-coenzyme A thioesterase PaaI-like protein
LADGNTETAQLGPPIQTGEWQGWSRWTGTEPFEDFTGPFHTKREPDGAIVTGFRLEPKNMNAAGGAHGGALMTFADYSLFMIAIDHIAGVDGVTIGFSAEFVGNAPVGSMLTCRGDVVKAGRSLIFVRGIIDCAGAPVLNFSGTIKVLRPRSG